MCTCKRTEGSNPSLSAMFGFKVKVMFFSLNNTVADRVGLRTVDACEPRQVRKEAAAAGCTRVAVLSGSVSSFSSFILRQTDFSICF